MKNLKSRLKLDKISQSSSPEASKKQIPTPLNTARGRIMVGGLGDSYLSFYKIQNEIEHKSKISSEINKTEKSKQTIAEKDQVIQNLQQTIMKETVKKNARQKCFQERLNIDWRKHIQYFIYNLSKICIQMSKKNKQHKKTILRIIHQSCNPKLDFKKRVLLLLTWILQWLQPILKMLHQTIRRKYH